MFALRRAAVRAFSVPSKTLVSKSRSITTQTPNAFRQRQQKWISPAFQRRFVSDDATKPAENKVAEEDAKARETQESFSQTAAEAPVDDSLSPASSDAQNQPTISSAIASANETVQDKAAGAVQSAADATESIQESATNIAESIGTAAGAAAGGWGQRTATTHTNTPNKTLYIGNLFFEVTDDQLKRVFSRFGPVTKTTIVYDNRGLSRGFGWVEFENQADATAAVENLHGQVFEGRNLNVQYHKPRNEGARTFVTDRSPASPSKTLFIGNMSFEMSDKDLNDLFRDIRNVMDVRVAIDRRTGQPRGFAHADFIDVASAEKAKAQLDKKMIYGRALRVDFSTSSTRQRRPATDATSEQ